MNQRHHKEYVNQPNKLLYVINVDWYFVLHWLDRAKAAQASGYEVHIATRITEARHRQRLSDEGFILHDIPFKRQNLNPLMEIKPLLSLRRVFRVVEPQLLHCITLKAVFHGGIANRATQHPCVHSLPGLGGLFSSRHPITRLAWHIIELLLPISLGQPNSITLFENQHDRSILTGNGVVEQDKTRVLPGAGVDLAHFTLSPEPTAEGLRLLYASRLLRSKGLPELVKAVRRLRKKGYDITLDVAGLVDNDSRDNIPLVQIEKWKNASYINWLGEIDNVVNAIHQCHIVCLPTNYGEGIPRILIEAAACGRPVITTDVPGCNEFVQHEVDGLLVEAGDIEELCSAISLLADDPEQRVSMGLAGREKVEHNYTNQRVMDKTLKIYRKITSPDSTAGSTEHPKA